MARGNVKDFIGMLRDEFYQTFDDGNDYDGKSVLHFLERSINNILLSGGVEPKPAAKPRKKRAAKTRASATPPVDSNAREGAQP